MFRYDLIKVDKTSTVTRKNRTFYLCDPGTFVTDVKVVE